METEVKVTLTATGIIFVGFLTGLYYRRVDHVLRTLWTTGLLVFLLWLSKRYTRPEGRLGALVAPLYNMGTIAVLSIFLAAHVSLVNVPFTNIDLFNVTLRDVDMISHFLGGLTLWLFFTIAILELRPCISRERILLHSFSVLLVVGIAWEFAEWYGSQYTETILQETTLNKLRDIMMEQLGALVGLWLVTRRGYPFGI